jgi:hypothetical protein
LRDRYTTIEPFSNASLVVNGFLCDWFMMAKIRTSIIDFCHNRREFMKSKSTSNLLRKRTRPTKQAILIQSEANLIHPKPASRMGRELQISKVSD